MGQQQQGVPDKKKDGGDKTGFPPPSAGPTNSDMEKQMAAKIAATTAYLNKEKERDLNKERDLKNEREQAETRKRKEFKEEQRKLKENAIEKEKLIEKESAMEDFKRLQARRREA